MVVVLGTAGAIALGATLVGGGATIGALQDPRVEMKAEPFREQSMIFLQK